MDCRIKPGNGEIKWALRSLRVPRSLNTPRRVNSEVLWRTCPAFQGSSFPAPLVTRGASAPARSLIGSSDAAAGLNALPMVLCTYIRIILGALDTVILGKPDIDRIQEKYRRVRDRIKTSAHQEIEWMNLMGNAA